MLMRRNSAASVSACLLSASSRTINGLAILLGVGLVRLDIDDSPFEDCTANCNTVKISGAHNPKPATSERDLPQIYSLLTNTSRGLTTYEQPLFCSLKNRNPLI